jgi:hypothetical protein
MMKKEGKASKWPDSRWTKALVAQREGLDRLKRAGEMPRFVNIMEIQEILRRLCGMGELISGSSDARIQIQ